MLKNIYIICNFMFDIGCQLLYYLRQEQGSLDQNFLEGLSMIITLENIDPETIVTILAIIDGE